MDNSGYVTLTRQSGLLDQLDILATNIANADTTGYRREATVFSEYVKIVGGDTGSISMATLRARFVDMAEGVMEPTGGVLDVAIEGPGFFLIGTPDGERLTRAGAFTTNAEGLLVTLDGHNVLDDGGGQIALPPGATGVKIGADGTISTNEGLIGRLGVVEVEEAAQLRRDGGSLLIADGPVIPAEGARVAQGFLESSNVNPLVEITRLIEVQRAYELGQSLTDIEAERAERVIRTLGARAG